MCNVMELKKYLSYSQLFINSYETTINYQHTSKFENWYG